MKREEPHRKAVRLFPLVEHRGFVWLTCGGAGESCVEHTGLYCRQVCVLELTVCATYIKVNQHSVVIKVNF